jgi:hypothetical protein
MIITNEKIKVTSEMMQKHNMTIVNNFGIPVDPKNTKKGLNWKSLSDLEDSDFDKIEEFFLIKKNTK